MVGLVPKNGNDLVYTPLHTAEEAISNLPLYGKILDPSAGHGVFAQAIKNLHDFDIDQQDIATGHDFLQTKGRWDWIVTNPPWSLFKEFLSKSTEIADNVAFLVTITHFVTKARLKILQESGFFIRRIHCLPTPEKPWPQSGFQVAMVWCSRQQGDTQWIF